MSPPYTYRDLCKKLQEGTAIKTFSGFTYHRGKKPFEIQSEDLVGKKTLMIRHDVDHYPALAHEMACVEASLGIRSTYFILTTDGAAKWWNDKALRKDYLGLIVEMQDMGHEIGLHYDFLGDYFSDGLAPKENIESILSEFRGVGLTIAGAASHGSSRMRKILGAVGDVPYPPEFVNYRIWKECSMKTEELSAGSRVLEIPALSLKEYDLHYETYWVTKDWYFSDSGGNFWLQGHARHIFENLDASDMHPYEAIPKMKDGEAMQILIHPIWWKGQLQ